MGEAGPFIRGQFLGRNSAVSLHQPIRQQLRNENLSQKWNIWVVHPTTHYKDIQRRSEPIHHRTWARPRDKVSEGEAEAWGWKRRHHVEGCVRRSAPLLTPGGGLKIYNVEHFSQRFQGRDTKYGRGVLGGT